MIKDLAEDFCIHTNEYNTDITKELLLSLPEEVAEQLLDIIDNVQYVKNLISPNRRKAKDMPHDDLGRVIVDHENPHILEDMSYFTKAADHFRKHGCYTFLKPNPNPNSDYKKWIEEEKRRCLEGLVRPSDGEWITGFMYWYMNYCPIMLTKISEGSKKADRVEDFPEMWEGIYLRYHYQHIARMNGHHGIELARRGCSKSFSLASMMAHNFVLGENPEAKKRVTTVLTAYQKEFLADKDGTLSKFEPMINFVAENTEFPRLRLRSSSQDMFWQAGYLDSYGIKKGSLNTVIGVSSKDDSGKLRGKRGHIYFEEMGSFPNLLEIYDIVRQGMEEGDYTYGFAYLVGTSGEKESNFESAKTLLYNPESYNIQAIKNIYDKPKQGRSSFGYFFPAFVNRKGCYNKDGVSDVVKALIQILMARYNAKKSSDPSSLLRITAEMPITPAEAIIKVRTSYFPITEISERLLQLDTDPRAFDDVYVGELYEKNGGIAFRVSDAVPIRQYKVDNTTKGALEIYEMPVRNNGEVQEGRYIIGHDPVDNDQANSDSLSSTLVLDLFTDRIVAEYTGRQPYADENYEIVRKLCLFYNAKCLFEAHPYDQHVITPNGIKKWGDIKIGDTLFSINGEKTKVIDIPIDGEDSIYEITFQDGRKIQASGNHIWSVYNNGKNTLTEVTTLEMLNRGLIKNKYINSKRFFVPEAGVINYSTKELPIDPYTMGLLLAEGAFTKFSKKGNFIQSHKKRNYIQFSSSLEDAEFYKKVLPYPIKYIGNKGCSWHLYKNNIEKDLESLNLIGKNSYSKFIPDIYLYNDLNSRLELLKGLMDGDGCAVKNGASVFITTSKTLAENIILLCRSLGIKANYNKGTTDSTYSQNGKIYKSHASYRVAIHAYQSIFKLPRKVAKQHIYIKYAKGSKARGFIDKNAVIDIKYVGIKKCKCVTVDREDGLYLIGDYIVTHNCNKKGIFAYFKTLKCVHLLADTPSFLREKQLVKYSAFGSNSKGVNANRAINEYADSRIRDWLMKPVVIHTEGKEGLEEKETYNLYFIRSRALLQELAAYNATDNFDRIRALGMLMLYRQERLGSLEALKTNNKSGSYTKNDDFFDRNYISFYN